MANTQKITQGQMNQWRNLLRQFDEDGHFDQSGEPLSPQGIVERQNEIDHLRALVDLKVGQVVDLDDYRP